MELTHSELKALIAPYVLGALPAEEVPVVRSHMLSCEECMAEADAYSRDAGALLLTVDPVAPPEGFTERVLARVPEEQQSAADTVRRRWLPAFGVAFLALVLAVGALTVGLVDARRDAVRNLRVLSALTREDGIDLSGESGVEGKMVPTKDGAAFVAAGLDEPPEERTYQLWLIRDDQTVSVSTFEPSDGIAVLETPRSVEGFEGAAVTIEPAGGSPQPTTQPVMSSSRS